MKKMALLALALLMLLTFGGCAQDESKMMDQPVIIMGSIQYTYAELLENEASTREYYEQMNQLYLSVGMEPMAITDEAVRDETVNSMAIQAIVLDKAHQMGLTTLTEDEQRELSRRTTATMKQYRENVAATLTLPEGATEQEREAAIDAALTAAGITRAKVYRSEWEAYVVEKTQNWAVSGVTVTDEEFTAAFNEQVESQRATIDADPTQYAAMILNGDTPLYAPAGYRQVDWFYIAATDDDAAKIAAIGAAHDAAHADAEAAEKNLRTLLGEDADIDALVDQVQVTLAEVADPANITVQETAAAFDTEVTDEVRELVMAIANARKLAAAYEEQLALAKDAAHAAIAPEVDEALRRLHNGESWALVQEHYNDDADMYYGSPVVCEGLTYVPTHYVDAAMELTAPGEWTQGVYDDGYGCYVILYTGDVTPGVVEAETVREEMTAQLLATKQEESFNSTLNIWIEAASADLFINYNLLNR